MEEKLDKILSDLAFIKANFVTKEYLDGNFATKEYINKNFATKEYINKNFATKEYIDKNFATKEYIKQNFVTKDEMNQSFTNFEKRITDKILSEVDRRFEQQNKEIAEEFRSMAQYMSKEFQSVRQEISQQGKRIDKVEKEMKLAHDGYNARMYKIELSQSNLESKVYELEREKLISHE